MTLASVVAPDSMPSLDVVVDGEHAGLRDRIERPGIVADEERNLVPLPVHLELADGLEFSEVPLIAVADVRRLGMPQRGVGHLLEAETGKVSAIAPVAEAVVAGRIAVDVRAAEAKVNRAELRCGSRRDVR